MKAIVISADTQLGNQLVDALEHTGEVSIIRQIEQYPTASRLLPIIRAHAPEILFVSAEHPMKAMELAEEVSKAWPGLQVVGFARTCDPQILLQLMRVGIREFLAMPFDNSSVRMALARIDVLLKAKPPVFESTDSVYTFLPSKAGTGTTTLAMNAAMAASRVPERESLLVDLDLSSGMMRFLLKLDPSYSVQDATENIGRMDERLWRQMLSRLDQLDVMHAGHLNPDRRIDPQQIRDLIEYARRQYKLICIDLSGNLERYSLEAMEQSRRIFLVCTTEIASLHLAREKMLYLKGKGLDDRVTVLLNRVYKRSPVTAAQVQEMLGLPVFMAFPNDYIGVQKAVANAQPVEATSELGKQIGQLANGLLDRKPAPNREPRRRFVEYFSLLPGTHAETRKSVFQIGDV